MKFLLIFIVGLSLLLFVIPVSADTMDVPQLPAQISGTLYNHEGKPFPAGTVIVAEVNGVTSTYTITEDGKIGGSGTFDKKFLISGATAGSTITYNIQGTTETVTQVYNPETGELTEQIQLTIPIEIPTIPIGNGGGGAITSQPQQTQTVSPTETPSPLPTETVSTTAPTYTQQPITTEPKSTIPILGIVFGIGIACAVLRRT